MATLVAKRFSIYFGCWQQHITQPLLHPTKFLLPMTSYRCRRQESISVAINHRTLFNPVVVVVVVGARDFQPAATDITLEFCQRRCHFAAITFLVSKFANCIQRDSFEFRYILFENFISFQHVDARSFKFDIYELSFLNYPE